MAQTVREIEQLVIAKGYLFILTQISLYPFCEKLFQYQVEMLSSNNRYKDNPSTIQYNVLPETLTYTTILKISQNTNLKAQGALVLKGEVLDYKGDDLRSIFTSKGSLIPEKQKHI